MTFVSEPDFTSMSRRPSLGFQVLYPLAYGLFCAAYLPHFFKRAKQAEDPKRVLRERLGNYPLDKIKRLRGFKIVWVHAVSVGEVMAAKTFLDEMLASSPEIGVILTTVTPTGQSIAQKYEGERLVSVYMPFDFGWAIKKFLGAFHPAVLCLMETELWPQAVITSQLRGIPVGVLNARLSEKSLVNYKRFSVLFQPLFARLNFVLAQTKDDADRFQKAGADASKVHTMGNMKFDNVSLEPTPENQIQDFKKRWNLQKEDRILVAGSTHPGEEEIIFRIVKSLKPAILNLKCILAPRHIDRAVSLKEQAEQLGLKVCLSKDFIRDSSWDILILNELGLLKSVYSLAEVVYMGGSLIRHGGQNPIEPAAASCPILHGPHVFNFKQIYQELDASQGALLTCDEQSLKDHLENLFKNPDQGRALGTNAFGVISKTQGASKRHVEWVLNFMSHKALERKSYVVRSEKLLSPSR